MRKTQNRGKINKFEKNGLEPLTGSLLRPDSCLDTEKKGTARDSKEFSYQHDSTNSI